MEALKLDALTAISSIDGRYRKTAERLALSMSEFALMRARVFVEIEYLVALSNLRGMKLRRFTESEKTMLRKVHSDFSLEDARIVKAIEREGWQDIPATNHDVKAIEYFLKLRLGTSSISDVLEMVHFALTSEDVNSVSQAICLRDALEDVMLDGISIIEHQLMTLARRHAKTPMLARTHGQAASPTTFGKEMAVFLRRVQTQVAGLRKNPILVKWGGATGNYNAHTIAVPTVDWPKFARSFIKGLNDGATMKHTIRLVLNETTTQIEPHDTFAELFDAMRRINTILIDLSQDMWRYISDAWVVQRPKEGEVGSSAMPHKVNPIDFENAEGNLGVANALFEFFSRKLPVSRLQRDLSDSTVTRAFGTAFAHSLIGYKSLGRGFTKISPDAKAMLDALTAHPEVLSEAIQTVLRAEGVDAPYEKLKSLTRGKKITADEIRVFVESLDISREAKARLRKLRPETYVGLAAKIAHS